MTDPLARLEALRDELRRRVRRAEFLPEKLCTAPSGLVHGKQLHLITSKAKRKAVKCSRRSGKTYGIDIKLLRDAREEPAAPCLYLTLTRGNAKAIAWPDLLSLNDSYGLGGQPNLTDLTLTMPGGGQIQMAGCNTEREIAKIRGKKFKTVVVDEAQSIPERIIGPLLRDIIGPTLLDYDGELILVGTPPPVKAGTFYDSYAGRLAHVYEQHAWSIHDNVLLPAVVRGALIEEILAKVLEENGWEDTDPTYIREYLGKDADDMDALLYQYRASRNAFTELPQGRWRYVFGIDIGHDDSDAIAVLGWVEGDQTVYLVDEFVQDKQDVTDLAESVKEKAAIYHPLSYSIDQGGLGKKIAEEIRRRHQIPVIPAEKAHKSAYIKLINAALRKKKLMAREHSAFAEDCALVQKDPVAYLHGDLKEKPASQGGYHSDICDAVLYGWRAAGAWLEKRPPSPPTEDEKLAEMKARRAKQVRRQTQRDWTEAMEDEGF